VKRQFIDYAATRRYPAWYAWGVIAAGVLIAADAGYSYYRARQELAELERDQTVQRTQARTRAAPLSTADQRRLKDEWTDAQRVARKLSMPWDELFVAIESVTGNDIALLAVRPDLSKGQLAISGEAKDYLAALNYLNRLAMQPVLVRPYLAMHEVKTEPSPLPVNFGAVAGWRTAQ
jgi:hypothetical protein